jgi:hypothetical protein
MNIKSNSLTIKKIREAAKQNFPESTFKVFWKDDTLCLYFKEGVDVLAANVFLSLIKMFIPGLETKFRIEASESEFWN